MEADLVQRIFLGSSEIRQIRLGERMGGCGPYLIFKLLQDPTSKDLAHKLRYAHFCHVRLCPTCMWRRCLAWRARFYQAWPNIQKEYPTARYLHLVLTVPNCYVENVRDVMTQMSEAWRKMHNRRTWPFLGFIRSFEITRDKKGLAHPHIHALLMVESKYFATDLGLYRNREMWRKEWASALNVPKESLIHPYVRAVREKDRKASSDLVLEVAKYTMKGSDIIKWTRTGPGKEWFLELDRQVRGIRSVTLGGVIRKFINEDEISDLEMLEQDKVATGDFLNDLHYDWFPKEKHYIRTKVLSVVESEWWNRREKEWTEKRSS